MIKITADQIHAQLGSEGWLSMLMKAGIEARYLKDRHGPCPICGGKDRFRFDNKGRGLWYCSNNSHGLAGDGFALLQLTMRVDFSTARRWVLGETSIEPRMEAPRLLDEPKLAVMPDRVRRLLRETCRIADCSDAVDYLDSRGLWPLPSDSPIRAHPGAEYWEEKQLLGRFPALIVPVRNYDGEAVTAHVTYLQNGRKLEGHSPRKILSKLEGHRACAARTSHVDGNEMGVAEGWETSYSAEKLSGVRTWAALNAALVAKFEPPEGIKVLHVFADRDPAGLEAFGKMMERLQNKVTIRFRMSRKADWNDDLTALR